MLKQIVSLIFILYHFAIYPQSTWEYIDTAESNKEVIKHSIEFTKGKIATIATIILQSSNPDKDNFYLSRINIMDETDGKILKSVSYQYDSLSTSLEWIFYNDSLEQFYIVGEAHNTNLNKRKGFLLLTTWDSNLQLISDSLVTLEPSEENKVIWKLTGSPSRIKEKTFLGCYSSNKIYPTVRSKFFVGKLDEFGNISKINFGTGIPFIFFYDPENQRYTYVISKAYYLGLNFELIDSSEIEYPNIQYFSQLTNIAVKFPNDKYLISSSFDDFIHTGIGLFDKYFKFIKEVHTEPQEAGYDYVFTKQSFDYIDTSVIYFGVQAGSFNYFAVGKVNSDLKPYWVKYYGLNGQARRYIWSLTATYDDGIVISGGIGVDTTFAIPSDLKAWAIKLDSNGNTVSTRDPTDNQWAITVYPNPSSGEFKINVEGYSLATVLEIYDMQGRYIRKIYDIHEGENILDFSEFPKGIYVWKLSKSEKILGEGKWVRE